MSKKTVDLSLPVDLRWLADAPLFIDATQIDRFYDAVVRPQSREGVTTLEITEQTVNQLSGKLGMDVNISPADLLQNLATFLPFLKPEVKASAEGSYQRDSSNQSTRIVELQPITTPQRQLVQLTLHYLVDLQQRLFLVNNPADEEWRAAESIADVPRALVFLNLPGQAEARALQLPETKLIPVAAEFSNGKIEPLYSKLRSREGDQEPPAYPELDDFDTLEELRSARNSYWQWFDTHFSDIQAMQVVEQAAAAYGRIQWIDYRVPLTCNGDSLHLHICPAGQYDTGVFAYHFIRRGFKHGLRLVGTLKSEPDMNVLAIYEK